MHHFFTAWLMVSAILLLSGVIPITSAAAEVKDPERYKQELLAIEERLDAKLKELDEKLELCESLPAEMIQELPYTPDISSSDVVLRIIGGAGNRKTESKKA